MTSTLETSVQYLKGVGPRLAKVMAKLGVFTLNDLLHYFPRGYEDRRNLPTFNKLSLKYGEVVSTKGNIVSINMINTRTKMKILRADLIDGTAKLVVFWFNQPFLLKSLKKGMEIFIRGKVEHGSKENPVQLTCQEYEVIKESNALCVDRVVPIYGLTEGLTQKKIRTLTYFVVENYLDQLKDHFSSEFREKNDLCWLIKALKEMHYPDSRAGWLAAHNRLVFDELFYLQLRAALQANNRKYHLKGVPFKTEGKLIERWQETLPFELTGAQQRVLKEIRKDIAAPKPMNRLLQGDVGSGKTEVALASMLYAVQNNYQAVLMAPTEILAAQHYKKIADRLVEFKIRVVYRVGGMKKKEQEKADLEIAEGSAQVIIGTHALIQEKVKIKKLGLVVVDEQHRFGVEQRQTLIKKGYAPHALVMTATPIPRTLALTFYGDLDRSIIDELPPGRKAIETKWVKENQKRQMYDFVKKELAKGCQVYVVYPLVTESLKSDLKAATQSAEKLAAGVFADQRVELIHGKMKNSQKEEIMRSFYRGEINVLVATTVIEVGVDVPTASVMIIENAERFGLAQLHQLRGRVGRGDMQAYCFLLGDPKTEEGKQRLAAMVKTGDGFELAEVDLKLRGPGEFYGYRQSGLPDLQVADLVKDEPVLLKAKNIAYDMIARDEDLTSPENYELKKIIKRKYGSLVEMKVLN